MSVSAARPRSMTPPPTVGSPPSKKTVSMVPMRVSSSRTRSIWACVNVPRALGPAYTKQCSHSRSYL